MGSDFHVLGLQLPNFEKIAVFLSLSATLNSII